MATRLPNLNPPFRFTMVEENLFRGGYPKPRNQRFLKRLHLKTVLSLIPDKLMPEMQDFFNENNIKMLHLNVDKMKEDNIPLTYNKTIMALQLIIDTSNHPLYIHCLDGADVTGIVIACLRKLQMWSASSAMGEFARNLHTNVITAEEFEFIENFKNFEITIPWTLPSWLWGGKVSFRKHSSLRLKFTNPDMMTEEERELKELKEKKEKEKEDYYKKRKNDLLDNLFDPSTGARHRSPSHNSNNGTINSTLLPANQKNNVSGSPSPIIGNGNGSGVGNGGVGDLPTTLIQSSDSLCKEDPNKDPYLVDVDVDVDGVMMDGLDQVEYMNRGISNTTGGRFYTNEKDGVVLMEDELGEVYGTNEQGTRFTTEPISRTLEALALEGLTEF